MKGLNLRGVAEFCRTVVREPRLLLPQVSVQGAQRSVMQENRCAWG